jgi:Poly(ADP-ribose) polymerase and DNA-Ligase Zn-finger region
MANVIEAATTGRSKCRGCGQAIAAGTLRFGESVANPFAGGESLQWYHLDCGAYKRPQPFLETIEAASGVEGAEALAAAAREGVAHERLPRISGGERDPSGRAQCRHCRTAIAKGAWRITLVFYEEGRFSPAGFVHVPCARPYFETADVMPRVRRFAPGLTEADAAEIEAELHKPAPEPPPA